VDGGTRDSGLVNGMSITAVPARPPDYLTTQSAADMFPVVSVENLTKSFPLPRSFFAQLRRATHQFKVAVNGVSLEIRKGEVLGLVGPNGAGKTTLIKMLTTLLLPTSGRATIAGFDTVRDASRVRLLVGLVTSNERSFYWRLSGRQNLSFFADLYRLPRRESGPWIQELLTLVGLREAADSRFDGYSTGMKQRLALARGLLSRPRFLFMDEPTKGVDPVGAGELVGLIRGGIIASWKPTILITSHNLTEVERLCDRIALMRRGTIVCCGTLEELRRKVRPADVYRMTVRRLSGSLLESIAVASSGRLLEAAHRTGAVELDMAFVHGSEGFPRWVRNVVEAGGDLITCTLVTESFDDVFQKLVVDGDAVSTAPVSREPMEIRG